MELNVQQSHLGVMLGCPHTFGHAVCSFVGAISHSNQLQTLYLEQKLDIKGL